MLQKQVHSSCGCSVSIQASQVVALFTSLGGTVSAYGISHRNLENLPLIREFFDFSLPFSFLNIYLTYFKAT